MRMTASQLDELLGAAREKQVPGCTGLIVRRTKKPEAWHGFVFAVRLYDKDRSEYLPADTLPVGASFEDAYEKWVEDTAGLNKGVRKVLVNKTLSEVAVEAWEALEASVARGENSERTADGYQGYFRLHVEPKLGHLPFKRLMEPGVLLRWRNGLVKQDGEPMANYSVNQTINALSYVWNYANEAGYVGVRLSAVRPSGRGKWRPSQKTREGFDPVVLRPEEIERIIEASRDYWRVAVATCFKLGLRASEVVGLLWSDIDFGENTVSLSKQLSSGRRGRELRRVDLKTYGYVFKMPPELRRLLLAHREEMIKRGYARPEDYVFVSTRPDGKRTPFKGLSLSREITRAAKQAKVKKHITAQVLRRSYTTNLVAQLHDGQLSGANIANIAKRTRHSVDVLVGSYLKPFQDESADAAIDERLAAQGF